ncbi:hypothetical protein RLW55_18870 [Hyphomicrobium sp. B1]|uniref:hypothetical protein n=1 Tax=Hyphomicrobium sp. B1 TaxID=3075651 RepID=UPI003C2C7B17
MLLFLALAGLLADDIAATAADPPKDLLTATRAAIAATNLTSYDIGSRYAQARGASETCPGGKLTDKAAVLPSVYKGPELDVFNAQEKKIYDAWMRAKHCAQDDPSNQCKLVIDESCAAAVSEIGPSGSAFPGLFEITHP